MLVAHFFICGGVLGVGHARDLQHLLFFHIHIVLCLVLAKAPGKGLYCSTGTEPTCDF